MLLKIGRLINKSALMKMEDCVVGVSSAVAGKPAGDFAQGHVKLREESGSGGLWQATPGK